MRKAAKENMGLAALGVWESSFSLLLYSSIWESKERG